MDFIVQPGIIQGADYLNDMSSFYLVEKNGKQYLVNVSEDFIITNELAEKVAPKRFVIGNHQYRKAVYQLV